jgi:hypothetical protein
VLQFRRGNRSAIARLVSNFQQPGRARSYNEWVVEKEQRQNET